MIVPLVNSLTAQGNIRPDVVLVGLASMADDGGFGLRRPLCVDAAFGIALENDRKRCQRTDATALHKICRTPKQARAAQYPKLPAML
jgi:hypothetical protein